MSPARAGRRPQPVPPRIDVRPAKGGPWSRRSDWIEEVYGLAPDARSPTSTTPERRLHRARLVTASGLDRRPSTDAAEPGLVDLDGCQGTRSGTQMTNSGSSSHRGAHKTGRR